MIVYTGGTFDVPHVGHLNFFKKIKEFFPNATVYVALNTDDFITRFKGKPPLFSYEERKSLLGLIPGISAIVPNTGGEDSRPTIMRVEPDVIVIGSDWLRKDYMKQMSLTPEWLDFHKIALMYIPYTEGISTTLIKERLNAR